MVRRWSRINLITNNNNNISRKNYFRYFFVSFKRSIIFKKYRIKKTRFIRRALVKAKHKGNWIIYSQIFKNWVLDFRFSKAYIKYQFFNNFFLFKFLTYDCYHLNLRQFNNYTSRFFLSNHVSKQTKKTLSPFNMLWDFSNAPANVTYLTNKSTLSHFKLNKSLVFPLYIDFGQTWFFKKVFSDFSTIDFNFELVLFQTRSLFYKQNVNFYKILNLLWSARLFANK